ncbi:MAG: hypothetical protein M5U28_48260 [Sandaracinaceae bacterium]|nr:hypothetical protein [Sandaracinaceae bacterium]
MFQSPASRLREFVAKQRPAFTLIADPDMALCALYGLEASVLGAMTPHVAAVGVRAAATPGIKLVGADRWSRDPLAWRLPDRP